MKFGFIGPTYTGLSVAPDGERSVNLYPERIESGQGKGGAQYVLVGTPGRKLFATLPTTPVRGVFGGDYRAFAVGGSKLYEVFADGSNALIGDVGFATTPVQFFSNGFSLFVVSGNQGYLIPDGKTVTPVVSAVAGAYMDGYYIAQVPNSNQFQVSGPGAGAGAAGTWVATASKDGSADRLTMIIADHEQLWLWGNQTAEVWYDAGLAAPGVPFARIQGAFVEQGLWAPWSLAKLDNSLFGLGGDARGVGIVFRMNGFTPVRISNHAVENAIRNYPNNFDAIGYSYHESGHQFYVLSFPSGNATWAYDVNTGMWHERAFWDISKGQYGADKARFHAYAFGRHLVGDYRNGNIYDQSLNYYDDAGDVLRRMRTAPHISDEMKKVRHTQLVLDMQIAQGPSGTRPTAQMRFSDDGGFTFKNERAVGGVPLATQSQGDTSLAGSGLGEYKYRFRWRRLGASRDRVYKVVVTDPVQVCMVDAYLDTGPGTGL